MPQKKKEEKSTRVQTQVFGPNLKMPWVTWYGINIWSISLSKSSKAGTKIKLYGTDSSHSKPVFAWPLKHIYSLFKHSDKVLARHDRGCLNYPSCTMKYVLKATCRIKRHSKTKAGQILWAFNPSVSVESRPARPTDMESLNVSDSWLSAAKYFLIFHELYLELRRKGLRYNNK